MGYPKCPFNSQDSGQVKEATKETRVDANQNTYIKVTLQVIFFFSCVLGSKHTSVF